MKFKDVLATLPSVAHLRGLDVVRLNRLEGADSLVGATITDQQARWLGPMLAASLRIGITEEDP